MRKSASSFAGAAIALALVAGCSPSQPASNNPMTSTTGAEGTVRAPAAATAAAQTPITDADAHGFLIYGTGARCSGTDIAEMFMRTDRSALVVCNSEIGELYYMGYRISDGASIYLTDVSRQPGGFVAVNTSDNARYVITTTGFQLLQNGTVLLDESALEVGPPAGVKAAQEWVMPNVVLGSATEMGANSRGYGTEHPDVISMGNCASAVSDITWRSWGDPIVYGTGVGCVQSGAPPQVRLVASDLGLCDGVLAYRSLSTGGGGTVDICGPRR